MYKTLAAAGCLAMLTACAQGPDSIAPVSMAGAFDNLSCSKARSLLTAEQATLDALSAKQKSAVTGDAVGVFLIGVPVSSLSGNDVSGQIGTSKGKIVALEARLLRC